jgi:glycosyltransferase involved in cell wall biosynthesis
LTRIDSKKRKKVLFCIPSLEGGGAERVFATLLRQLDRDCFELHLALLQAKGDYLADIPKDVCIHELSVSRVRYSPPSILKLVWQLRPDTILSTLSHLNIALVMTKPFLPRSTRLLIRQAVIASTYLLEETKHPRLWAWLYRHFYKRADKVVCLSEAMINDMVERLNVPAEKLVRIYNPVDLERLRELADTGTNPYREPGPNLVAAGRLSRQKGFDVLLDAMPTVLEHLPNARLTILGEGPLRAELTEQVQRLNLTGMVRLPGFQQNPWPYLRHASLFVFPSRYEGLPNVLLEALALGTYVVATNCPGAIREVQECDDRMVLVPPEDPDALANAIVSTCQRPKIDGEYAERTSGRLSKFELQRIVREYSALLSG